MKVKAIFKIALPIITKCALDIVQIIINYIKDNKDDTNASK